MRHSCKEIKVTHVVFFKLEDYQKADRSWPWAESVVVLNCGRFVNPVENLGKKHDLDNLFKDSPCEPGGTSKVVFKVLISLKAEEIEAKCVPVPEEGSHDGESNDIFEDRSSEGGIKERDHDPNHADRDVRKEAGYKSFPV